MSDEPNTRINKIHPALESREVPKCSGQRRVKSKAEDFSSRIWEDDTIHTKSSLFWSTLESLHNKQLSSLCFFKRLVNFRYIVGHILTMCMLSRFSCPTLGNSMDFRLPGSIHGISQARILEWVAIPSSRRSSLPRDQTHFPYFSCIGRQLLYQYRQLGSPVFKGIHISAFRKICLDITEQKINTGKEF